MSTGIKKKELLGLVFGLAVWALISAQPAAADSSEERHILKIVAELSALRDNLADNQISILKKGWQFDPEDDLRFGPVEGRTPEEIMAGLETLLKERPAEEGAEAGRLFQTVKLARQTEEELLAAIRQARHSVAQAYLNSMALSQIRFINRETDQCLSEPADLNDSKTEAPADGQADKKTVESGGGGICDSPEAVRRFFRARAAYDALRMHLRDAALDMHMAIYESDISQGSSFRYRFNVSEGTLSVLRGQPGLTAAELKQVDTIPQIYKNAEENAGKFSDALARKVKMQEEMENLASSAMRQAEDLRAYYLKCLQEAQD